MTSRRKSKIGIIAIVSGFLCVICFGCIIFLSALGGGFILSTPSPAPVQVLYTPPPMSTVIALTYSAATTQTAMVSSPVPLPSATLAPAIENIPTATIFIFQLQTDVAQPTEYIYSTNTPFTLATQSLPIPPQSSVCSCSGDTLNCGDFSTHSQAQACYDYCVSLGQGDVHNIDGNDKDGLACESLP